MRPRVDQFALLAGLCDSPNERVTGLTAMSCDRRAQSGRTLAKAWPGLLIIK